MTERQPSKKFIGPFSLPMFVVLGVVALFFGAIVVRQGLIESRAANERQKVRKNLKQIGIALQRYDEIHRILPTPAVESDPTD
ncbi:DUF1559 domain-containing protein [Planctomicrobium piriforme]|uniref:DUF1559 domain-containing protein n=1 Tax=Planctomicrobium piriforme TaxID=1576369 RepID=A0A1I3QUM0_9PLAN|nr:DUF1559 domain-containing protein [Planctomicrobium piriforme]SFJ37874.1 Protein of unknown function [Planctomicrobium piriforme]